MKPKDNNSLCRGYTDNGKERGSYYSILEYVVALYMDNGT